MKALKSVFLCALIAMDCASAYATESKSLFKLISEPKKVDYQSLFEDVLTQVQEGYVEEVNDKKLIEAAIEGMLTSLDPYSCFLDEQSTRDIVNSTRGESSGIAVEITLDKKMLKVITPYENGPAFKAGIKAGDIITAINNEPTKDKTLSELAEKLRGPAGTTVTLSIYRESNEKIKDIKIVRDIIKMIPVSTQVIKNNVLYINITIFNAKTAHEIQHQYQQTMASIDAKSIKGVILDMRWNPGGLFDQAVAVSNLFLDPDQLIVTSRGRSPESNQSYYSDSTDITNGLPLIILANEGTASSPEVVVGALQDNKRAVIVGAKTFGKASMQSIIPLGNNTSIKLTTAKYYTPSGSSIHGSGITPDIMVEDKEIAIPGKKTSLRGPQFLQHDPQLRRAISLIQSMHFYSTHKESDVLEVTAP